MQRDVLRELAQLVRYAEPEGHNLGAFVTEHASELAHLLQSDEGELLGAAHERDGALVDRLRVRLEMALDRARRQQHEHDVERARRASRELARTARWFELGAALDVDVLLADLLADPKTRFLSFAFAEANVVVATGLLRRARFLRQVYLDLAAYVNDSGVHVRWKAGMGALNVYAVECNANEDAVLIVPLPPRLERRPMLIGDVLAEMGLGS